jgi:anti-sigma-K factor RskA
MTDGRDRAMTHDEYAELVAAYAIDALEPEARVLVEVHLTSCTECQAELADLQRVSALLAQTIEPVAPPPALKARTIARATAQTSPSAVPARSDARSDVSAPLPKTTRGPSWLALAASLLVTVGLGAYAWSLRQELSSLRQQFATVSAGYENVRAQLIEARRDSVRLTRIVDVLRDPAVMRIDLRGVERAAGAQGNAFVSRANGVLFQVSGLPALPAGRIYQLWVITPKQAPVSGGVFSVDATGAASLSMPMPPAAVGTRVVAVTEEAGPAGAAQPTSQPILLGQAQ